MTVGAACFADVDLLFQFVDGRNHHNNELHGIGFALLGAVAGAAVFRLVGWTRPLAAGLALGIAYATHPFLDYLNVDTHPPIGLLALWPFSHRYYKISWPIFMDIGRTLDWHTIRHDTVAALWEVILLGPILVWAWRWRTRGTGAGQWREGSRASQ